ncbi:hypothetical protein [Azospirillum halopraeferens]|uniref:hypothetical protein n=1 Tax=Azospirillum halopraeferens TaxID=34010 RepID=UPI000420FC0F|nr:hypothetical protein [Azospirillum halopraeferens]
MPAAFLPFWFLSYVLAAFGWLCVARFAWERVGPADPRHPVSRTLRMATDWLVAIAALVTPRAVPPVLLVPLAAAWVFFVRGTLSVVVLMGILHPGWGG